MSMPTSKQIPISGQLTKGDTMPKSIFTEAELGYLRSGRKLARLATVGTDGTPHVTPVGWRLGAREDVIEVGGIDLPMTKKFRDIA